MSATIPKYTFMAVTRRHLSSYLYSAHHFRDPYENSTKLFLENKLPFQIFIQVMLGSALYGYDGKSIYLVTARFLEKGTYRNIINSPLIDHCLTQFSVFL